MDDVFALSPISARPAQPSEADYEAIRDAFMETSRGRWFLGEYAKRNRNADTSMVLDAVARIEQALAAQQRLQQLQEQQQEAANSALPEALAAIRHAIAGAEGAAAAALDSLGLEQNLAPVRKGIRIIKEISWRWREIGADSRICDLIDSQVVAIEAACDQLAGADPRPALIAAFDLIRAQLDGFDGAAAATPAVSDGLGSPTADMAHTAELPKTSSAPARGEAAPSSAHVAAAPASDEAKATSAAPVTPPVPSPATTAPAAAVTGNTTLETAAPIDSAAAAPSPERVAEAATHRAPATNDFAGSPALAEPNRPAEALVEPVKVAAGPAQAKDESAEIPVEVAVSTTADDDLDIIVVSKAEADAHDEAILKLVAAEMAAPDPTGDNAFAPSSTIHFDIEEPTSVDDDIIATFAEPSAPEPKPVQRTFTVASAPTSAASEPRPETVAPELRSANIPKPSPVAPPPAPAPQATAPAMPASAKPAPAVQERPAPVLQVQEQVKPPLIVQEQPATTAMLHPLPKPMPQPSLGATLLASGLLQRPVAANDPLTPIRRMTQPEKIAFFS